MIDFAVDCYAYVSSYRVYPGNLTPRNWTINGFMLAWRKYFLEEDESEEEQVENTDQEVGLQREIVLPTTTDFVNGWSK